MRVGWVGVNMAIFFGLLKVRRQELSTDSFFQLSFLHDPTPLSGVRTRALACPTI